MLLKLLLIAFILFSTCDVEKTISLICPYDAKVCNNLSNFIQNHPKTGIHKNCVIAIARCVNSCYCSVPPCLCCRGCFECLTPLYTQCCSYIFPRSYCPNIKLIK